MECVPITAIKEQARLCSSTALSTRSTPGRLGGRTPGYVPVFPVDLPSFGLTGPRPRDYTIDSYVSFLEALATLLALDSFALAGHSLGGAIAWRYALETDRVTRLILVAPFGYRSRRHLLAITLGRLPVLRRLFLVVTPR